MKRLPEPSCEAKLIAKVPEQDVKQTGWRDRLREEELNGFAFAFKARSVALGVIVLWVLVSSSWGRLPMLLMAAAAFLAVGWVAFASRNHRHTMVVQGICAFADVAILVTASHFPEQDWNEWALQSWMRRSAFIYLVAYVACSALTFSVTIVLLAGVATIVGQVASFVFVMHAAGHVDSFQGFFADSAYDLLRQLTALQNVEPWVFMVNQIVLLAVTTGLIAGAIWRARRHVERAVLAEARSSNLGRYFSPAVAERLADDTASLDRPRPGRGRAVRRRHRLDAPHGGAPARAGDRCGPGLPSADRAHRVPPRWIDRQVPGGRRDGGIRCAREVAVGRL
jgi:adenylate cyclase